MLMLLVQGGECEKAEEGANFIAFLRVIPILHDLRYNANDSRSTYASTAPIRSGTMDLHSTTI
jgi:hypothetical protein